MKPLPKLLQSAFPCKADRFPPRPWWQRDGVRLTSRLEVDIDQRMRIIQPNGKRTESRAVAFGEWDAVQPCPHPGFRVGQVWARVSPQTGKVETMQCLFTEEDSCFGNTIKRSEDIITIEKHSKDWFLMVDSYCPHLAPWGPGE